MRNYRETQKSSSLQKTPPAEQTLSNAGVTSHSHLSNSNNADDTASTSPNLSTNTEVQRGARRSAVRRTSDLLHRRRLRRRQGINTTLPSSSPSASPTSISSPSAAVPNMCSGTSSLNPSSSSTTIDSSSSTSITQKPSTTTSDPENYKISYVVTVIPVKNLTTTLNLHCHANDTLQTIRENIKKSLKNSEIIIENCVFHFSNENSVYSFPKNESSQIRNHISEQARSFRIQVLETNPTE